MVMGSKLRDNLSNRYYQRRNLLNARPNLVKALVEDGSDISIWERMLKKACPWKFFDVKPYQGGSNRTKSKQLVIRTIMEKGGPLYIGCVDADLDKFLEIEKFQQVGGFFIHHIICSIPMCIVWKTYSASRQRLGMPIPQRRRSKEDLISKSYSS